jgi:hypothetical protein
MLSIWKVTKQTIFDVARISRSLRAPMSSRAGKLLTAIAFWTFVAAVPAVADTFTLDWAGGYWNDGGSLAGTFTVEYDAATGAPTSLVSADVTTGNGISDGFLGQSYVYDVSGLTSTVDSVSFDATQYGGAPANELVMTEASGYRVFLDWQGVNPTALWVGNPGSQYSSENNPSYSIVRYLNTTAGSAGSEVPEPASFVLSGLGLAGAYWFGAAKLSRSLAARRPRSEADHIAVV